jgi:hypothetical protein
MDKLKFGLFDIFVYTIPGTILLLTIYLTTIDLTIGVLVTISNLTKTIGAISFNVVLLIILVSYILGFALHFLGYNFFNRVGKRIWKKLLRGKEQSLSTIEQRFVLVRHYSKENFAFVEQWYTFRAMSFNLSLVFLLTGMLILIKILLKLHFSFDWSIVILSSFLLSLILLRRAITFHLWSHNTLNEAVNTLGLLNKPNSDQLKEKNITVTAPTEESK